jgi:hypothetical protein
MKKLSRLIHDKRAITAVLSHLLLTVVAVAVMAGVISAAYVITGNLRDNMGERFIVEDVWFNSQKGTVDIYVHNIGRSNLEISNVYINHIRCEVPTPLMLEMESSDWLSVTYQWNSGQTYDINIVTTRGTHNEDYYKAP